MNNVRRTASQFYRDNIKSFFILYFVQGLPYGLQTRFLPIYFRFNGMSLTNVGLYRLLLIPWVLKTLYAPIVDNYGSRKSWLFWTLLILSVLCLIAAEIPPSNFTTLAVILFLFNMVTSVMDIALDALVLEVLTPSQLAMGNIAQVVGYKGGTVFSGGIFAWLTGMISWRFIFYSMACLYFMGFLVTVFYLPQVIMHSRHSRLASVANLQESIVDPPRQSERDDSGRSGFCSFFRALNIDGTLWTLAYVLIYKIGEQGVINMFPMFLLDEGVSVQSVGFWTGFVGQCLSLIGSALGGLFYTESMVTSLKIHLIIRAVVSALISGATLFWASNTDISYVVGIFCLMVLFTVSGAITTCTFTLVMQLSQKAPVRCRATHYTILAVAEVLGRLAFSAAVGVMVEEAGYLTVFVVFTILCLLPIPMIYFAPDTVFIEMDV